MGWPLEDAGRTLVGVVLVLGNDSAVVGALELGEMILVN